LWEGCLRDAPGEAMKVLKRLCLILRSRDPKLLDLISPLKEPELRSEDEDELENPASSRTSLRSCVWCIPGSPGKGAPKSIPKLAEAPERFERELRVLEEKIREGLRRRAEKLRSYLEKKLFLEEESAEEAEKICPHDEDEGIVQSGGEILATYALLACRRAAGSNA